jgi:hypothetical protein
MPVAAAANALTTVANVKYVWGRDQADLTHDDRIQTLINLLSGRIESWCGRSFKSQTYTAELYDGNCDEYLALKQYPITAVTTVKEDDVTVDLTDTDDIKIHYAEGLIYRASGWPGGVLNIEVTYTAGYATIPSGLEAALVEWVILLLEDRMKDAKIPLDKDLGGPQMISLALAPFKRRSN